jgi:ribosomal-protein-alanine N-acetyltransferase
VDVAWRLASSHHGRGLATEAAQAVMQYGFQVLGFSEIVSMTVEANRSSWRVMEKLGMTRDPGEDFDHPHIEAGSPLRRHLLYRLANPGLVHVHGDSASATVDVVVNA